MVIDCSSIIDIEYTALKMLADAEEKLQREGVRLWLAHSILLCLPQCPAPESARH
jgi:hypothetical protein